LNSRAVETSAWNMVFPSRFLVLGRSDSASSLAMRGFLILSLFTLLNSTVSMSSGQTLKPGSAPVGTAAVDEGVRLAETGHCAAALPLLKKSIRQISDKALRKRAGLDGVHCAMTGERPYDSLDFLQVLLRDFPRDPEVLYIATHAYSDLALRSSQDLMREAPFSYQVHQLNAEALETQGKWEEAAAEYRKILDVNPMLPGIHARLGRVLLSGQQPTPDAVAQAKKNFEDELSIDPNNAGAEYVLAELAKDDGDFPTAIRHYARATKIDAGFAEAYFGLGSALVASKQFADAIAPLETYEKLAPDSPSGHFQLALAYNGVGRKEDANREAALQRDAAKSLEQVKRRVAEGLERQKPPQ
jgi:tetratricopeptide (TPR) repeat protein